MENWIKFNSFINAEIPYNLCEVAYIRFDHLTDNVVIRARRVNKEDIDLHKENQDITFTRTT